MNAADVAVEPNELRWRQRVFDFERVTARSVAIDWIPSSEPAAPPASLASPIDLRVRNLNVAELRFGARGDTPSVVGNIAADVRLNADEILVERAAFQHGPSRVTLSGRIDARSPFALRAQAQVASTLREHGVTVQLRASATLLDAFVEIDADSADARVQATARLTPFAPVPLAQLERGHRALQPGSVVRRRADDATARQRRPETGALPLPGSVSTARFRSRTWTPDRSISSACRCDQRAAR